MKYPFLFLISALLMIGCQEKQQYALHITYPPQSYLPAYPGSFWVYNNGDSIGTGSDYVLSEIYTPTKTEWQVVKSDTCTFIETAYFPNYGGYVLKNYTRHSMSIYGGCVSITFLSETLGEEVPLYSSRNSRSYLKVVAVDTVIVLPNGISYDSVIVMKSQREGGPPLDEDYYYAKHVGFIGKKTFYDYATNDSTETWNEYLVDYYINN